MIPRKKPNPNNPQTGRKQHPKSGFAATLNFLRFQLLATSSNVASARYQLERSYRTAPALTYESNLGVQQVLTEARTISARAKALAEEIAELNSPDKWAK